VRPVDGNQLPAKTWSLARRGDQAGPWFGLVKYNAEGLLAEDTATELAMSDSSVIGHEAIRVTPLGLGPATTIVRLHGLIGLQACSSSPPA